MIKIAIIGAGSVVFARNFVNDILMFESLRDDAKIYLMDIDQERLETAYLYALRIAEKQKARAKIYKTMNQKEAIEGSKYVINTIQVGGLEATYLDFDIPEKYGLRQTIADTHGIGAMFRAIRTIPEVLDLAHNMEKLCPSDAILLNYSNPMAMVTWSVFKTTKVNIVGLCHSIQKTARQIASYIDVNYYDLRYRVGGINHIDWFLELEVKGKDVYPLLFKAARDSKVYNKDKVRFELMKLFGYFVSESSAHAAEYFPYFIKEENKIKELDIPIREYIRRCEINNMQYEEERKIAKGEKPLPLLERSVEYAAKIINSMETGESITIHGNVENNGLIPNLPEGCCVEIPVLINKNGLQSTYFGDLPPQLAEINRRHIGVQDLIVSAILEHRKDYLYQSALLDPLASSVLDLDKIIPMVDDLLEAYKKVTYGFTEGNKNLVFFE